MSQFGMVIDVSKCIGCYACSIACENQNNLAPGEAFIHYETQELGEYPHVHRETVPLQCMHCTDAPCQQVCPTGATYTTADGLVMVETTKCIGCLYCMAACPYQVRVVNPETHEVRKCRFCHIESLQGKEPSSCVAACPTNCRVFGDLEDPESEISQYLKTHRAKRLKGDLTKAHLYYVR
ncbi:MAG: 4Fe-4S dicluster domain-containing protein [Coriobacteriia bacterium]|nr:4Fe-4S dicluster domain-containing protein [Coriobacteriia bacterium]